MNRAIINCQYLDVITGKIEKDTTIFWKGKIIQAIGKEVALPDNTEIINGEGCFVTPGLINVNTHIGLKEHGVRWEGDDSFETSGIEQYNLSVLDGIYPFDQNFNVAQSAGVTTVHVLPSAENVIGGRSAILKTTGNVVDEMVISREHGLAVSFGAVPKQAYMGTFKRRLTRMRIASLIRHRFIEVKYKEILTEEDKIIKQVLNKELPVYARVHRADDIITVLRLKEELDFDVVLVHSTECKEVLEKISKSEVCSVLGPFFTSKSRDELRTIHPSLAKTMDENKIPFTIASPTVRNLKLEAALAVREGLATHEALAAITINAAKLLKIDNQCGSLETGKEADIVLWDKEPMELLSTVQQTIIGGKTVYIREAK